MKKLKYLYQINALLYELARTNTDPETHERIEDAVDLLNAYEACLDEGAHSAVTGSVQAIAECNRRVIQ